MNSVPITAKQMKLALMHYYRFNYQNICVDEFNGADVIVDTGKKIIEIETKITVSDLIKGEAAKNTYRKQNKHELYALGKPFKNCHPNVYYLCVPDYLQEEALKWIKETNESYGLIIFNTELFRKIFKSFIVESRSTIPWVRCNCFLNNVKRAKPLHNSYELKQRWLISSRLASKAINLMNDKFLLESITGNVKVR